jgi:hypothetical protein
VIIGIHAVLETLLAFMNHFPLFVLMLRIKDPLRLPGSYSITPSVVPDGATENRRDCIYATKIQTNAKRGIDVAGNATFLTLPE